MAEVLHLSMSFPSVVFTVLLGVVLAYWAFVMVGVIELGEGSDGALDGLGDHAAGAGKGALEGTAKGMLEGSAKGVLEGHLGSDGDMDLGESDGAEAGVLAALMSALKLRQVPVTTVFSLIVAFSWLSSVVAMQALSRLSAGGHGLLQWAVLTGSPILALPLTALAVRPLAGVFVHKRGPSRTDFVGKTCVVRTGKVTEKFGEATLEDGGAGLVVRVRVSGTHELKRGDHALIIDWDAHGDTFVVEPMKALLSDER